MTSRWPLWWRLGGWRLIGVLSASLSAHGLAGCAVGPDYERPPAAESLAYKELAGWKLSEPQDLADRGDWWAVYSDPVLDDLEKQVDVSNQNLKAAEASYRLARAIARQAWAGFFPTFGADATVERTVQHTGQGRNSGPRVARTQYEVAATGSWEPDIWGRVRRTVESDDASAQASAADLAGARLSAQAELATDYFALRVTDEQQQLLDETVEAFTRSLEITQNRYAVGTAAKSDVAQAEAQLEGTRAQAISVGVQRAQFEHAIAVLVGKAPSEVTIDKRRAAMHVPVLPPGLPSTLLERRPDIAAAERRMAAANAQIGVAVAAYFPNFTINSTYAYLGPVLGSLIQAANSVWSMGAQAAETIFDAGARGAAVDAARASYDQTVAEYRQTVLLAFEQVEDQLAALRILAQQADVQANAVRAAREAEALTLNQYKAGTVAYTTVVTAQATALSSEQNLRGILQSRLTASVGLIQALGGGWNAQQLREDDPMLVKAAASQ